MLWSIKIAISITVNFIFNYYLSLEHVSQLKKSSATNSYIFMKIKGLNKGREVWWVKALR